MGRPAIDLADQRFGRLRVTGRAPAQGGSGIHARWAAVCDCGVTTVVNSSALRQGQTRSCGCLARETARDLLAQDSVKYVGAHGRVYRAKGKASAHPCSHCSGPADEWAYDHTDPNEVFGLVSKCSEPVAYSMDPDFYIPLCRSCHSRFDRKTNRSKEEVSL